MAETPAARDTPEADANADANTAEEASKSVRTAALPAPAAVEAEAAPAAPDADADANADADADADAAEGAFDDLYVRLAPALVRQAELLTGQAQLARDAVARAFDVAWQRWPEVARDPDPVGWVRAVAYEYALAPWQRWVPGHRPDERQSVQESPLQAALLRLPPEHRRAVLLYDGLGLDLPEAAVETESSVVATAGRITRAREELTAAVPELGDDVSGGLTSLLAEDAAPRPQAPQPTGPAKAGKPAKSSMSAQYAAPTEPAHAAALREASERGVRRRTAGVFGATALIAVATLVTVLLAPDHRSPQPPREESPGSHAPAAAQAAPDQHLPPDPVPDHHVLR